MKSPLRLRSVFPNRGKSKSKGPEVGIVSACLRTSKVSVAEQSDQSAGRKPVRQSLKEYDEDIAFHL